MGRYAARVARPGHLIQFHEPLPYLEAWELQRSLAAEVLEGARPDTVVLLEHPPVVTTGRASSSATRSST